MKKKLAIGQNVYSIQFDEFEEGIEVEDLLKIDMSNIIGEVVTFPVIVNRLGLMLAEADENVSLKKLDLEVYEAKAKDKIRDTWEGSKAPTVDQLQSGLIQDAVYQVKKKQLFVAVKTRDYVNSIFWSAKDKSGKLDRISTSVQVGDVDENLLEGKINNILIKRRRNIID